MELIVQKFGGTSVADTTKIKNITDLVKKELNQNNRIVIIVSAMAGVTNHLITLCNEVSSLRNSCQIEEYDAALSSGEIVTAALLALSLQENNIKAKSFAGWQLPLWTNKNSGQASIIDYNIRSLKNALANRVIPIIAGFQGINKDKRITTLGRGGSDITAVLTAAALKADRCDIYTDVEGIYTADPRIVHHARKLDKVSYEQMLEFSSSGAKVLHPRSVELAMRYKVPLTVLSAFSQKPGTLITSKNEIMENKYITGITSNKNIIKVVIEGASIDLCKLSLIMATDNIQPSFIQSENIKGNFSLLTSLNDKNKLENILNVLSNNGKVKSFNITTNVALVTVVGYGMKTDDSAVQAVLEKLAEVNISIEMMEISEIKISLLINDIYTEKSISALHKLIE